MIHIILGTKAQLIKMAPLMVEMKDRGIDYNFIITGQHKDTMKDLLENFGLRSPDFELYSGKDITSVAQMFFWGIRVLFKFLKDKKSILRGDLDGIVLVHGDTYSTVLGAFMGRIARMKVGHVEAGLRSFKLLDPFPEELARIITSKLATHHYCPGDWAEANASKYKGKKVNTIANTLLDSFSYAVKDQSARTDHNEKQPYAVATLHRFKNVFKKEKFEKLIEIVEKAALKIKVLFILHVPTEKKLKEFSLYQRLLENENIALLPRLDYFSFIKLINGSDFVISDGGSNQEECYYLGKPCLLLRESTERKEGLGENVVLSKYDKKTIDLFLSGYSKLAAQNDKKKISPSRIIIDDIACFA